MNRDCNKSLTHTELTTYLDCPKKWYLIYHDGIRKTNENLQFGIMAHKTMCDKQIPDEVLYPELKDYFSITSWDKYFTQIFTDLAELFPAERYDLVEREHRVKNEEINLEGIIDLVLYDKIQHKFLICDYKFCNQPKTENDLLADDQLYLYAMLYSLERKIPISEINVCYISILKRQFVPPRLLANGKLSKDKTQCTTYKLYVDAIKDNNLNIDDYQDALVNFTNKKSASIVKNDISYDRMKNLIANIETITNILNSDFPIYEQYGFRCTTCAYFNECKKGEK